MLSHLGHVLPGEFELGFETHQRSVAKVASPVSAPSISCSQTNTNGGSEDCQHYFLDILCVVFSYT